MLNTNISIDIVSHDNGTYDATVTIPNLDKSTQYKYENALAKTICDDIATHIIMLDQSNWIRNHILNKE